MLKNDEVNENENENDGERKKRKLDQGMLEVLINCSVQSNTKTKCFTVSVYRGFLNSLSESSRKKWMATHKFSGKF